MAHFQRIDWLDKNCSINSDQDSSSNYKEIKRRNPYIQSSIDSLAEKPSRMNTSRAANRERSRTDLETDQRRERSRTDLETDEHRERSRTDLETHEHRERSKIDLETHEHRERSKIDFQIYENKKCSKIDFERDEHKQRSRTDFEVRAHDNTLDHGLSLVKTVFLAQKLERAGSHLCSPARSIESYFWKQSSESVKEYSQNEKSPILLCNPNNEITYRHTQPLPQLPLINTHSNYENVFHTSETVGKIRTTSFHNRVTPYFNRRRFCKNYRAPMISSTPRELTFRKMSKYQPVSIIHNQEINMVFGALSNTSLFNDKSLTMSPPISSLLARYKKLCKLKRFMLNKEINYTSVEDAMHSGIQDSPSDESHIEDDDVIHAEVDTEVNKIIQNEEPVAEIKIDADAKSETRTAVYSRRWYLLFLFSVSAMLWNAVWSTWGPIAQSAKLVYGWTDGDIAMFIWLGNIPFIITMFPSAYMMDVSGMRIAMIAACCFMFLGTGFRCIPSDVTTASWLIRVGQFLNGVAGTIPNSGPALLSALWFPPNQRASATAISTVAGYMGASISFIIGPLLVPEPNDLSPVNNTDDGFSYEFFLDPGNNTNSTDYTYEVQKSGIMKILYAEFGVAGLLLLLVLIYFPSKPPLPPSMSASIPREKYMAGLKMLVRNKQFWVCALAFSIPIGVYESWQVILDVNLYSSGISQDTAGWLDFYATLGGCISGLLVSRFADFFTHQMKLFLVIFYIFASVAVLWFTLVVLDILPFDNISIYAAIIIAGVFLDGGGPLFFELTIEVSHPVGEGVTSGFTQMLCAAAGIVFLSVAQVESLGKQWMNWCFCACVAIAIPLLFFINTTYRRADIDDMEVDDSDDEEAAASDNDASSSDKATLIPRVQPNRYT